MQKFYEIYDYHYPPWWTQTWAKVAIAGAIIALVLAVILIIKWKKRKPLLPWEWADAQLKKLSPQSCKTKDDFKKFYFELTMLFKRYFNKRYFWLTEDKTDDEFIVFLQEQHFDQEQREHLAKIFTGATWIKFANEEAIRSQASEDLAQAHKIIEKTKPTDFIKKP